MATKKSDPTPETLADASTRGKAAARKRHLAADPDFDLIPRALAALKASLRDPAGQPLFEDPAQVHDYLRLKVGPHEDREMFGVLWLDGQGYLIEDVVVSVGTRTETQVCIQQVLRNALGYNAHACIVYHNHPSGVAEPSDNDLSLTENLGGMLKLLDVELLDHFIVGNDANLNVVSVKDYAIAKREAEANDERRKIIEDLHEAGVAVPQNADLPLGLLKLIHALACRTRTRH